MGTRVLNALAKQKRTRSAPALGLCLLSSSVFLLLAIPERYRDVVFLAGALFGCALAFYDFARIWRFFLLILPLVHTIGSLFGLAQLSVVRLVLVGTTVVLLLLSREVTGHWRIVPNEPGLVGFLLFVAANLFSAVHTLNYESVFRTITYLEPALFFILTYQVVRRDSGNMRQVVRIVALGGVVVCLLGFVEMKAQRPVFDLLGIHLPGFAEDLSGYLEVDRFGLGGRITSTIGQPVYAGIYFVIWLVACAGYIVIYRPAYRSLLFLLAPIGGVLILATGSRAPLFALPPAVIALVLISRSKGRTAVRVGLGLAMLSVTINLAAPTAFGYLRESLSGEYSPATANVLARLDLTNRLLAIFWEHPVFGYGPGLIQKAAIQGSPDFVGLGGLENQYAVILADGGILAGGAYLLFMIATLWSLLRLRFSRSREVRQGALMMLLLFMFYFVVTASVTSITQLTTSLLMTLLGALGARAANDRDERVLARG